MSYDEHYEGQRADYDLGATFQGLHRDCQAVLAYATLHCVRSHDTQVSTRMVSIGLGLPIEAVEECIDALHERGLAWRTGIFEGLDLFTTELACNMVVMAHGPGGRPNARDWRNLREEVFARVFAGREPYCVYCRATGLQLVLDHAVPVSRGGSNHPNNLLPACEPCNSSKRAKTYSEFMAGRK